MHKVEMKCSKCHAKYQNGINIVGIRIETSSSPTFIFITSTRKINLEEQSKLQILVD